MKNKNITEIIFQKIATGKNSSENKVVKEVTPKEKQPQQNQSIYDSIINTIKDDTKGEK